MKKYQERILSFGQKQIWSRWYQLFLILIAITTFAEFLSRGLDIYYDPERLVPLDVFNAAGLLAFSLATGYGAITLMKGKRIKSKNQLLVVILAFAWGAFPLLMKIYPWNLAVMAFIIIGGLLLRRKVQWEPVEERGAEHDRT